GATLSASVGGTNFNPISDVFTIIAASGGIDASTPFVDAATGNTLADGAVVNISGWKFFINYNPNSVTLTAVKADTSTTVTSSLAQPVTGQSVTFTATVSSVYYANVPYGSVTFIEDGSITLGTATI